MPTLSWKEYFLNTCNSLSFGNSPSGCCSIACLWALANLLFQCTLDMAGQNGNQGDQIGRTFAYWTIVYILWTVLFEYDKNISNLGPIFYKAKVIYYYWQKWVFGGIFSQAHLVTLTANVPDCGCSHLFPRRSYFCYTYQPFSLLTYIHTYMHHQCETSKAIWKRICFSSYYAYKKCLKGKIQPRSFWISNYSCTYWRFKVEKK
jgi:hypothetical protein